MGIVVPETCWARNKICNKNHMLHLVGILFPHIRTNMSSWRQVGFRQHEIGLVNRLCPRIEGNAYESRHLSTLLSCIGGTLFYLCDENYLSTGSLCALFVGHNFKVSYRCHLGCKFQNVISYRPITCMYVLPSISILFPPRSYNCSLLCATRPKPKEKFSTTAIVSLHILRRHYHSTSCYHPGPILTHILGSQKQLCHTRLTVRRNLMNVRVPGRVCYLTTL